MNYDKLLQCFINGKTKEMAFAKIKEEYSNISSENFLRLITERYISFENIYFTEDIIIARYKELIEHYEEEINSTLVDKISHYMDLLLKEIK